MSEYFQNLVSEVLLGWRGILARLDEYFVAKGLNSYLCCQHPEADLPTINNWRFVGIEPAKRK
jgi:hypothetical protein